MDEPQNSRSSGPSGRSDLSGRLLGRFLVKSRLGEGGMGQVYLAEDTRLKRLVALKRISPHLRDNPRLAERFRREVELTSRLSHPHIAAVYDVFEHEGESFLVMEYVEGETLRQRMHAGSIPLEEFLEIARQTASALAAAHEHGVLHRDLKPENIILTRDHQVKILDFGLAKDLPLSAESTLAATEPGLKGTPGYMAPEALLEKPVDARADLFSLGVVLYEILAGRHPFMHRGDSFVTTVNRILGVTPKPLSTFNQEVTPQVEAIVSRLLEKDPIQRYATATQLGADLKAAAGGSGISSSIRAAQPRRKRRLFAAIALGVAACAAAGFLLYRYATRPRLTTNDWILMTSFSNETGQPIFDDTVSQALRDAAEQSRVVRLVPRAQEIAAARLMGERNVSRVDAPLGRQICQREGYRGLLTGTIRFLAPDYVVTVQLEDPESGVPVYTTEASFRQPAQLYPAVDKLAHALRAHLGESLADIRKTSMPLAQVTTPSLAALQRYTRAVRLYDQGHYPEARVMMQSALSADPDFAMAHLYAERIYEALGDVADAAREMKEAVGGLPNVSERERYLIRATNYAFSNDYAKAVEQFRLLTELYPNDLEAWHGLGIATEDAGMNGQAIDAERHVLTISPDSGLDSLRLVVFLDAADAPEEALATYEAATKRGIDNTQLHRGAGVAYMMLDNIPEAEKQFALCAHSGELYGQNIASLYQAGLLLYQGKLSQAIDELRTGMVLDIKLRSQAFTPLRRYLLGGALLAEGKTNDARREVRELGEAAAQMNSPEYYALAGQLALETGQRDVARNSLAQLAHLQTEQPSSAMISGRYNFLLGAYQLANGDASAALESERRAYTFYSEPLILLVEAHALAALNRPYDSAAAYSHYIGHAGQTFLYFSPLDWALAHSERARELVRAGRDSQALAAYDHFLNLWSGADETLPALKQARAERAQLTLKYRGKASPD